MMCCIPPPPNRPLCLCLSPSLLCPFQCVCIYVCIFVCIAGKIIDQINKDGFRIGRMRSLQLTRRDAQVCVYSCVPICVVERAVPVGTIEGQILKGKFWR